MPYSDLSQDQRRWLLVNGIQPEEYDRLNGAGLGYEDVQNFSTGGVNLRDIGPEGWRVIQEQGLSAEDTAWLQGRGWGPTDLETSGLSLDQLRTLNVTDETMQRMRGIPWTEDDITRWENRARYGEGVEGHLYRILDEERRAFETGEAGHTQAIGLLQSLLDDALGQFDAQSDVGRTLVERNVRQGIAQANQNAIAQGLGNNLTTSIALGGNRSLGEALAQYGDQRTRERIGLQSGLTGNLAQAYASPIMNPGGIGLQSLMGWNQYQNAWDAANAGPTQSWSQAFSQVLAPGNVVPGVFNTGTQLGTQGLGLGLLSLFGAI